MNSPDPPSNAELGTGVAVSNESIADPRWRPRARRILRRVLIGVGVVVLIALGVGYWALDRFVIDHIEISNVQAYEAQVKASTSTQPRSAVATALGAPSAVASSSAPVADPVLTPATPSVVTVANTEPGPPSQPVFTDTTYVSDTLSIEITKVITGEGDAQVVSFIADVVVNDATRLSGGFADNAFGTNIVANTSTIAAFYDAVFAINGDYYGFRESGIVIRNGVLFRDEGARSGLAMYVDGSMAVFDERTITGQQLVADGVWNTVSFGPALLNNGHIPDGIEQVEVDTNFGNHSIQGKQPRTGLGMIAKNHFVFVVVDGRSKGYSRGVTMTEFAAMFRDLGATVAYNLDGGGSATMWFAGKVVNNPLGKGNERGTSDILFLK